MEGAQSLARGLPLLKELIIRKGFDTQPTVPSTTRGLSILGGALIK